MGEEAEASSPWKGADNLNGGFYNAVWEEDIPHEEAHNLVLVVSSLMEDYSLKKEVNIPVEVHDVPHCNLEVLVANIL